MGECSVMLENKRLEALLSKNEHDFAFKLVRELIYKYNLWPDIEDLFLGEVDY